MPFLVVGMFKTSNNNPPGFVIYFMCPLWWILLIYLLKIFLAKTREIAQRLDYILSLQENLVQASALHASLEHNQEQPTSNMLGVVYIARCGLKVKIYFFLLWAWKLRNHSSLKEVDHNCALPKFLTHNIIYYNNGGWGPERSFKGLGVHTWHVQGPRFEPLHHM